MSMPRDGPQPKIGAGHAEAMFRQGLKELRAALYPESNVAQQPEYGLYGSRTPGEVAEGRRLDERDLDVNRWERDGGSVLDERLQKADASRDTDRGREDKDLDKEP